MRVIYCLLMTALCVFVLQQLFVLGHDVVASFLVFAVVGWLVMLAREVRRSAPAVAAWLIHRARRRPPDFVVGGHDAPYLNRWWLLPRNPLLNIYLHQFLSSDDDRALHDHPWCWCSIILRGGYVEVTQRISDDGRVRASIFRAYLAGAIRLHRPTFAHRLEIDPLLPCWTLFITGPRVRNWGFHCPKGWVPWERFTAAGDKGAIGAGCGEG